MPRHQRIITQLEKLSRHVRNKRIQRGWSQEELAHQAGVTQSMISRIENQKSAPSAYIWLAVLDALGIELEYKTDLIEC